ncbi:hypothetical protein PSU4_02230 [Pseudonocardia sulfidoxydans NBRC 16205]|uniref:Uncharacterized protein n=1 Tax=Pseudonocardia sulfidoxydans NBRC 16205 TaxID=1223511 RepID=A0A511D8Y2_9PSEU|nr:hypothetical protein [Pseudonocardia sulfidoxydans]GEL21269.1 hypothetical protein PSU4_02230 [Pseudonocardia sulfidoxydans NBRC 16205]
MTAPTVTEELGVGTLHLWSLPTDEATLLELVRDVFTDHWEHIHFGTIVQGAAWEVAAPNAPRKISSYDGYVTVDFGRWHFHLCIGEHTASGPALGALRRCARAEFYRHVADGTPTSWGIRLFNGGGDQLMTVMLPNPFLDDRQNVLDEPDFGRLAAWDALRGRYLGLAPDPLDRTGRGFRHG